MCMLYIYIYIPSMYKSLKVKYVQKHTTLGFDKSPDTKFLSRLLTQAAKHGGAVRSKQDQPIPDYS